MNNADVPIWEKYTLTIEEASLAERGAVAGIRLRYDAGGDKRGWILLVWPEAGSVAR